MDNTQAQPPWLRAGLPGRAAGLVPQWDRGPGDQLERHRRRHHLVQVARLRWAPVSRAATQAGTSPLI